MKVYRCTVWSILKGVILTPAAGAVVYFGVWAVVKYLNLSLGQAAGYVQYGVPALVMLATFYVTLVNSMVSFRLLSDGRLQHRMVGITTGEYQLKGASLQYANQSPVSGNTTRHDLALVIREENGKQTVLDAGPLGAKKLGRMLADIQALQQTFEAEEPAALQPQPVEEPAVESPQANQADAPKQQEKTGQAPAEQAQKEESSPAQEVKEPLEEETPLKVEALEEEQAQPEPAKEPAPLPKKRAKPAKRAKQPLPEGELQEK
ncbi:MAG: hypothetical protein ACK5L3_06515 [Oscillospiraceae bacterium]